MEGAVNDPEGEKAGEDANTESELRSYSSNACCVHARTDVKGRMR